MLKKTLIVIAFILIIVGCQRKEFKFNVDSDLIILDQSEKDFFVKMLDDHITLTYGDEVQNLNKVDVEGNVDLSTIDTYEIKLLASHKSHLASTDIVISVVDREAPVLHVFEDELLVHIDETIDIDSNNFFINLSDGINGQISDRIEVIGDYDLSEDKTYKTTLLGTDASGNEVEEDINIRVTDIIDEKALYLHKKAMLAAKGDAFIFKNNDSNQEIINFKDAMAVFTPTYREHFLWLSGITGNYNPIQSGVKITLDDNKYYANYDLHEGLKGYKKTKLKLEQEVGNYRHYIAESTYEVNGEDEVKLAKFSIRKIDGSWLVDEFYLQY